MVAGDRSFDQTITVPFPPESAASGVHDPTPHPIVWYRRTFEAPAAERLLLHFGAVDYRGEGLGERHAGRARTSAGTHRSVWTSRTRCVDGPSQVVVVRAEDRLDDLTQPRGKQYWEPRPEAIWYHRTTGIWQPVWLEPVAAEPHRRAGVDADTPSAGVGSACGSPVTRPTRTWPSGCGCSRRLARWSTTGTLSTTTRSRGRSRCRGTQRSVDHEGLLWSPASRR